MTNMTDILSMIYDKFPETQEPPVSNVLLIFNREFMEAVHGTSSQGINANKEAKKAFSDAHIRNLTIHNLNVIDEIVESGLWNGRVRVVEAGSELVRKEAENPYYSYYSNIVGGIVNFFLAIQSSIFIGTEVSTYSTLVVNSRLYRGIQDSYFYRPQGLSSATIHNFKC